MLHRTLAQYYSTMSTVLGKEQHLLYIFAIFGPLSGSTFAAPAAEASELTDCEQSRESARYCGICSVIVCGGIYDVCHFRVGTYLV